MPLPVFSLMLVVFGLTTGEFVIAGILPDVAGDLAVPIPPKYLLQQFYNNSAFVNDAIKPLVTQNSLWAFEIASGKIAWRLGKRYAQDAPLGWGSAVDRPHDEQTEFSDIGYTLRGPAPES